MFCAFIGFKEVYIFKVFITFLPRDSILSKSHQKKKKTTTKTKLKIVSEIISTKQIVICYLDSYSTFPEILGVSSSQII